MGKTSDYEEAVGGKREKQSGASWSADMKNTLGFEWQGADLFNGGPAMLPTSTSGASPLALICWTHRGRAA